MKNTFFVLFFAVMSIFCWGDRAYTYENKETRQTTFTKIEFKAATGYVEKTEKDTIYSGLSYTTDKFVYTESPKKTNYTAIRRGKEIEVTGTLDGNPLKKAFSLGGKEWFQSMYMAMQYLMTTDLAVYAFWTFRADTVELYEFELKRTAKETITINGEKVVTQKMHIGLTGFLSIFWGGFDSWVRLSDGIPVKLKNGDIETILVSEKSL